MGVKPNHYLTHLSKWHTDHSEVNTSKKARMLLIEELMLKGPTDPTWQETDRLEYQHGLFCPVWY
jgi:hypothetical protein